MTDLNWGKEKTTYVSVNTLPEAQKAWRELVQYVVDHEEELKQSETKTEIYVLAVAKGSYEYGIIDAYVMLQSAYAAGYRRGKEGK